MFLGNVFTLKASKGIFGVILLVWTSFAESAGFAIAENSASGLGAGFSGGGAIAEDGSAAWFNPAGMRRLDNQVGGAFHAFFSNTKVGNATGSKNSVGGTKITLPGSSRQDDISKDRYIPSLYAIYNLNEDITLGISVNSPWGLSTKYDDPNWVGLEQARTSIIKSINFNPSIAASITDNFHIGAGINILYFDTRFTSAISTSFTSTEILNSVDVDMQGDDIGVGFNVGLLYEFNNNARASIHYRGKVELELEGDAKFDNVPTGFPDFFKNGEASSDITLPEMLSVSGYWRFVDKFAVTADYTFTRWSEIQSLDFWLKGDGFMWTLPINESLEWEDVNRVSLGFHYYHNSRVTLRTGFVYDESPVKSARFRTTWLPDTDRYWLTVGGSYQFDNRLGIDIGYAHVFMKDTRVERESFFSTVTGDYENSIDIFSAQVNYKF